jgi:hypothetical protein
MKHIYLLAALLGCGSNALAPKPVAPAAAQGLDYQDPQGGAWRLVRNPSSTVTRLVLDLRGPPGLQTRGVGFNLKAPAGVRFGAFAGGLPVEDAGVYQLAALGSTDPDEPVALVGGVQPGNVLSVGVFQKDRGWPAQDSGVVLLRIALELDASAGLTSGTPLAVAVMKAKAIPEDIGAIGDDPYVLKNKLAMQDVAVSIGKVTAL